MTDRVKGFTVTLSREIRDDDFEWIQNAVKMIEVTQRFKENRQL